ncbi:hypothetical protein N7447_000365 [Penicillium robsamsonii]|uniref:uncharacterized protein n=1 Tax=Penicillium robsamsonii TaxID=1792511 RepID=UPI002546992F|nr:uncharacterized protein N7447_000365 [Penicillium robsamsonii]KAJ5834339.1 hypothetical protein N7447_000365 [Penicillium robsamsonii]
MSYPHHKSTSAFAHESSVSINLGRIVSNFGDLKPYLIIRSCFWKPTGPSDNLTDDKEIHPTTESLWQPMNSCLRDAGAKIFNATRPFTQAFDELVVRLMYPKLRIPVAMAETDEWNTPHTSSPTIG